MTKPTDIQVAKLRRQVETARRSLRHCQQLLIAERIQHKEELARRDEESNALVNDLRELFLFNKQAS